MRNDRVRDLDLMMHVDGELPAAESERVESALAVHGAAEAHAKVAAVRELGELVRGHIELATDDAEPKLEAMWHELSKRLDNERAAPATAPAPAARGLGWLAQWFERYRSHVLTSVVSAGAVAALVLIFRPAPPEGGTEGVSQIPPEPVRNIPAPTFVSAPPEIESLDVPNGTGTVLTIEDEDGAAAIVWVTPEDVEDL